MKKTFILQSISLGMYIGGIACCFGIFMLINKLVNIELPTTILAVCILQIPLLSAILRIIVYTKRDRLFMQNELKQLRVKIYFWSAIAEMLTAAIGMGFVLSS